MDQQVVALASVRYQLDQGATPGAVYQVGLRIVEARSPPKAGRSGDFAKRILYQQCSHPWDGVCTAYGLARRSRTGPAAQVSGKIGSSSVSRLA
jgi:hypothetical protein